MEKRSPFFTFLLRLRIHESRKADRMCYLANNILPHTHFQRRKKKDREREEKIKFLTSKLLSGQFNIADFLLAMAADENGIHS